MLQLTFYFFTPKWESASDQPFNQPYFDNAFDGITAAEQELFGADFTDNWTDFFSANPTDESFANAVQILGITKFPTLVIYDDERQLALFKLEGRQITKSAVQNACVLAWSLEPDPDLPNGYITPNRERVDSETLLEGGACPDWVKYLPAFAQALVCNKYGLNTSDDEKGPPSWIWILLLLLILFLVYKKWLS